MKTETIYNENGAYRFEHEDLPIEGTIFIDHNNQEQRFDGVGPAGLLLFTDMSSGFQSAEMPTHLVGWKPVTSDEDEQ